MGATMLRSTSVSYLGPAGTYSEEAAVAYCGTGATLLPAGTTDEALAWAESGKASAVVLPIENSTEGTVNHTLDLLQVTPLTISGELALPIHHQLLSRAASVGQPTTVLAHPQALAQCRAWLDRHMPQTARQPAISNGEAARMAVKSPALAAIASSAAATAYDLPVLAVNIEDDPGNTTRFVVLSEVRTRPTGNDTTSLICAAPNTPGELLGVLTILSAHGINMTKLHSRPVPSELWRYVFYIDIDGHQQDPAVASALKELDAKKMLVKLLGSCPKAAAV